MIIPLFRDSTGEYYDTNRNGILLCLSRIGRSWAVVEVKDRIGNGEQTLFRVKKDALAHIRGVSGLEIKR